MFQKNRPKRIFSKKQKSGFRIPLSLILLLLLAALFWLIPVSNPPSAEVYLPVQETLTPLPTITLTPEPTLTVMPKPSSASHGGRIIFTCTRGDYNQLCMVNRDGSGLFRLTNQAAHDYYPSFAPQGGAIVFASNRNRGFFDLYLMILNSSKIFQLTDRIGNVFSPDFSPDGEQIIFGNRVDNGPSSLWIAYRTGANPRLLYEGPQSIVAAAWSPNGKTIAFAMAINQLQNEFDIFLMDVDGTEAPRRLNTGLLGISGSLDWSIDGRYLLIVAGPWGDKDIFRYDVETGAVLRLTAGGNNNSATYSPDGEWIAFNSLRNNDQADIYIMHADGSDEFQLTDDPEPDWQPQWEP